VSPTGSHQSGCRAAPRAPSSGPRQEQQGSRVYGLQGEQLLPARPAQTWLVLEYCELGSLADVLTNWQHLPCYGRERMVRGRGGRGRWRGGRDLVKCSEG
jgi:hypothetical protein